MTALSPILFFRLRCRFHMMLIGRRARHRSIAASQPIESVNVVACLLREQNILPTNTEKSDCLLGGQHFALPVKTRFGFHNASTGRHCTKVRIMATEPRTKLPPIAKYIRNARRHLLFPMIRRIRKATDTLPVTKAIIVNGWMIQLSLETRTASVGTIIR